MVEWRDVLSWIESSFLGNAIRDSGVWTYGVINLLHILGVATLFGSILILDLRLLGWRRSASLAAISSITVPVSKVGFFLAVVSGVCLLATNATEYVDNPFLLIKFVAIGLGLVNVLALSRLTAWKMRNARETEAGDRQLAVMGGVSLTCWMTAVSAGRMIGYW